MITASVIIKPYQAAYQPQIVALILGIQRGEFNIPITIDDQPDLLTIETFYQAGRGNFWCALTDEGQVVGTISLIDTGNDFGTIRKMFVHPDYRGRELAVATTLLQTLETHAASAGLQTLYLGTVDVLVAAQRFYARNGYALMPADDLPDTFPRMRLDNRFFYKHL